MKASTRTRGLFAASASIAAALSIVAGSGQAATSEADAPWLKAIETRSQVLNEMYGLGGGPVISDPAYLLALRNQADALGDFIRRQANPAPVTVSGGFDWADAGIGVGTTVAAFLLAGAGLLGLRRRSHLAQLRL